jgi:ribonuclease HII
MTYLVGVDEAGRGPLAGPVQAVAFALPVGDELKVLDLGVKDSKKISAKKRERIYHELISPENGFTFGIAEKSHQVIDSINILQATFLAMREAIEECVFQLPPDAEFKVMVDGNQLIPLLPHSQEAVIDGDNQIPAIAAASIIAKVTRDTLLVTYDTLYPEYGFGKHKGYGTKAHREALTKHGLSPVHRRSFCKKFL